MSDVAILVLKNVLEAEKHTVLCSSRPKALDNRNRDK